MKAQLDTGCYVFSTNSTYVCTLSVNVQNMKMDLNNGSSMPDLKQNASSFEIL